MNKKFALALMIGLIFFAFAGIIYILSGNSNQNRFIEENINAEKLLNANKADNEKPSVVFFHSVRCGYCIQFAPIFGKLAQKYHKNFNFVVLDVENPDNAVLSRDNVLELPSVYIFDPLIGNKVQIPMAQLFRDGGVEFELNRYLRIRESVDLEKAKKLLAKLEEKYRK